MSRPLSNAARLQMRKELVRLRMEMHRQQVRYHAQPLIRPLARISGWFSPSADDEGGGHGGAPLALAGGVVLGLFGKRLGKVGKLARLALTFYPLISRLRSSRARH